MSEESKKHPPFFDPETGLPAVFGGVEPVFEEGVFEEGVFEGFPPSFVYNYAKANFAIGVEDWDTLTYKVTLVTASYSPDWDHVYASAFSGDELTAGSYTGGFGGTLRKTLTGTSVVQNDTNDRGEARAANVAWSSISAGVAYAAVVLRETTSDGVSPLIAYVSGGFPITTGGTLTLSWNSAGVFGLVSA